MSSPYVDKEHSDKARRLLFDWLEGDPRPPLGYEEVLYMQHPYTPPLGAGDEPEWVTALRAAIAEVYDVKDDRPHLAHDYRATPSNWQPYTPYTHHEGVTAFSFNGSCDPDFGAFGWAYSHGAVRPAVVLRRLSKNRLAVGAITNKRDRTFRQTWFLNGGSVRWAHSLAGNALFALGQERLLPPAHDPQLIHAHASLGFMPSDAKADELRWWAPRKPLDVFGPGGYHTLRVW